MARRQAKAAPEPEAPAAEWVALTALRPWADNPRRNDGAVSQVAASIKRLGWGAPIVARRDGEIIAGHTRWKAAQALGLDRVPVRFVDLDPADAKLMALADNRLGEIAEWDEPRLAELLGTVGLEGAELAGWDSDALEQLGKSLLPDIVEDEPGEPPRDEDAITKPGDMIRLGRHTVICGDCREHAARLGDPKGIALAVHDPPYGNSSVTGGLGNGERKGRALARRGVFRPTVGDDGPYDPAPILDSARVVVAWGANHYASRLPDSMQWIVWDKRDGIGSNDLSDAELAWVSEGHSVRTIRHKWNGFNRASERGEKRVHRSQKPAAVIAEIIGWYSEPGDTVTDYYLGSGTTLIACEQAGRTCVGTEISPAYCDVIVERWEKLTGGKAERDVSRQAHA